MYISTDLRYGDFEGNQRIAKILWLFHFLDLLGHETNKRLVVFLFENLLKSEQLWSFAEEPFAILKWIVLLVKLRFHCKCLQEI